MWPTWPVSVARHCSCGSDSPFLPSPWVIVAPATGLSLGAASTHCPTCIVPESGRSAAERGERRSWAPGSPYSRPVRVGYIHIICMFCSEWAWFTPTGEHATRLWAQARRRCRVSYPASPGTCRAGVGHAFRAAVSPTLLRATAFAGSASGGCALRLGVRGGLAITAALVLERVCLDQAASPLHPAIT
jgi:hypothetical protein